MQFSNVACLAGAGNDLDIQAVVIEAGTLCDESTYTSVSNCESGTASDFTLTATGLSPNTVYYVMVDGDLTGAGITNAAECDFDIEVSGAAVEFDLTTTIIDQTCGNTDGEITINTTSGGTPAYQYSINNGAFQAGTVFSNLTSGTYVLTVIDGNNCQVPADTVLVNLLNGPQINATTIVDASCNLNDGSIDVITVVGGNPAYTYSLNGGATQGATLFSSLGAGTYTVLVSDQQNCEDSVTVIINNASGLDATASTSNSDCGLANGSITINAAGGTNPITYSLNAGAPQASPIFANLSAGVYSVLVTDGAGCTYTLNGIIVAENPPTNSPQISITASSSTACQGDNISFTSSTQNPGTNPNYNWMVNGVSVQNGSSDVFSSATLNDGDIVSCELTSDDPCVTITTASSDQVTMIVSPIVNPTVTLASNTTTACSNVPVIFTATENGCNGTSTFQWMVNGSPVASDTTGIIALTLSSNANVSVNLTCSEACSTPASSNTVNVTVTTINANAGSDQVIGTGQTTQLQGSGGGTYSWAPGSSLSSPTSQNPLASPGSTTTYTLIVTNNGCTDTAEVTVFVTQPINIPNTFTPNGDGVNDLWEIYNIESFPNCKVTVYDRWGQRVYNSIGYTNSNGWNGTNNGLSLPAATYYYVIDLNSGLGREGDIYSGSITLIF